MFVPLITLIFFGTTLLIALIAVVIASGVMDHNAPLVAADPASPFADSELIKPEEILSTISPWARLLERFDFVHGLRLKIAEADLDWSVGRASAMMLLAGTLTLAVLAEISWMPGIIAVLLAVVALLLPYFYILGVRARRFRKFEELFPEALDSLVRGLRAGHPFAAGMETLAAETVPPVSLEMRKTLEEWKLGMTWSQALDNLAQRIPVLDVAIFVAAVKLHTRTGGRLGEVLGKLAESMRENAAIQGEVRALAAHGRLTGLILTCLPVIIAAVMIYVNPVQMRVLIDNPIGKDLILAAAACLVTAHFIIRKIVDIHL